MEGSELLLGVGETQSIAATVVAANCRECHANIRFDEEHFELIAGEHELALGSGTFKRSLEWQIRARNPGEKLIVELSVTEGGALQLITLPVRILPAPDMGT